MPQTRKLGKGNTTVRTENGWTIVRFYRTDIVRFNSAQITLDSGGWNTRTTVNRMDQARNLYGLGDWHVRLVGGKRIGSTRNNIVACDNNPTGARMIVTYGRGLSAEITKGCPVTFNRSEALPDSLTDSMAQTDTATA